MKIVCDFCKTEYSVVNPPSTVRCAICGHVFGVSVPNRRNGILMFFAATVALISAGVFATAVIIRHNAKNTVNQPLVATISNITTETDNAGVPHFVVSGTVSNQSSDIYGVPDLIIVSRDVSGRVVARQKFLPSATLLDSGASVNFTHTLSVSAHGIKKVTVELGDLAR